MVSGFEPQTIIKMAEKIFTRRKYTEAPLKRSKPKLPIHYYEEDLIRAVEDNDFLIVVGETGSGKTTQLPQFLHRSGFTSNGEVIGITQPRRIAAISVASRVAEEIGCTIGGDLVNCLGIDIAII